MKPMRNFTKILFIKNRFLIFITEKKWVFKIIRKMLNILINKYYTVAYIIKGKKDLCKD